MSNQQITDYLTKQLFIEKNIVTFRSLSRELRIHVNDAKNELALYHDSAPYQSQTAFATYLLSGELGVSSASQTSGNSQDVDMDEPENTQDTEAEEDDDGYGDDGEEVVETTVMLVNEKDLDSARSKYRVLESIHVYSLAPSPLRDAGLICTPNENIRAVDVSDKAAEVASVVGRIISPIITVPPLKKSSKPKDGKVPSSKSAAASKEAEKPALKNVPKTKANFFVPKPAEKKASTAELSAKKSEIAEKKAETPKPSVRVDSSAVKPKESKPAIKTEVEKPRDVKMETSPAPSPREAKKSSELEVPPKRGTKRKSAIGEDEPMDDKSNTSRASTPGVKTEKGVRVKKGALLSDDEDEEDVPQKAPKKGKNARWAVDSDEDDVTGLMDIDDDKVTRVSRAPSTSKQVDASESEDAASDKGDEMDLDEPAPAPKPKQKRAKKQIPIGSNGLKKKRVMRQRQTVDAKGYTIFEDYTSYESDNGEEPEEKKPKKSGSKTPKVKKEEDADSAGSTPQPEKTVIKAAPTKSKPTPKTSTTTTKGQPKQKSLKNFFVAPKKA